MKTFLIDPAAVNVRGEKATLLTVGFATNAETNNNHVKSVMSRLEELALPGGGLLLVTGPASLPVAMALAHGVAHRYSAVACFCPPEKRYVVAIAHGPAFKPGDVINAEEVVSEA